MKNYKKYYIFILSFILLLSACKKEEIMLYQDDAAIYFAQKTYSYSFIEDIGAQTKTIYLPVLLSGETKDYDRFFEIEPVYDTTTTAPKELFEISQGVVPKNSFNGSVAVVLKRNVTIDNSIVYLKVNLIGSDELDPIIGTTLVISWTGKIIQPVNWNWLRYYFGTPFSTAWYTFILEASGRSSLPYNPTLAKADPDTWWMGLKQLVAYQLKVKEALMKYNAEHPGDGLKHDDGDYAGQFVTMP